MRKNKDNKQSERVHNNDKRQHTIENRIQIKEQTPYPHKNSKQNY